MNNIATSAVSAINETRKHEAIQKARVLVLAIASSNKAIKAREESLTELTEQLKKLANDKYNTVEIAGDLPKSMNATTIIETIAALNKGEQEMVAERCADIDAAIRSEKAGLDSEIANRTELLKKLTEITFEEVTPEALA